MKFNLVDTESIYRRLLETSDASAQEAIFRQELIEPFRGLVDIFGGAGGDGLAQYAGWGMSPEQFAGDRRDQMAAIIEALAKADAWNRAAAALDKGYAAFAKYADRIPQEAITFGLMIADMSGTPQAHGYTGFGGIPGWIMTVYGTPDEYNLERVEACTVHELHHNLGSSAGVVFNKNFMVVTVGEYMIGEGLAESFAAELYGADKVGPWVSEFDASNLEQTKAIFRDALTLSGFNVVRSYIFGDGISIGRDTPKVGVPTYAGYALGYRVVQAYLKRTGKTVVEATFVPAMEVIEESRFFA